MKGALIKMKRIRLIVLTLVLGLSITTGVCALDQEEQDWVPVKKLVGMTDGGPDIITYVGIPTEFKGQATSPDSEIIKYEWDFDGDGVVDWESSIIGVATYTFLKAGKYTAVFKAYDDSGLEIPLSIVRVIVREEKGKPKFIPKRHFHRSNLKEIKKEKRLLEKKLDLSPADEDFLEMQINSTIPETAIPETNLSLGISSTEGNLSPLADGIKKRYVLMINVSSELRFWDDVRYAYETFNYYYGISDEDIYLLNYTGLAPDGTNPNNMIDYSATRNNLQLVCNHLVTTVDADDLLYVWVTDHGRGYS